MRIALAWVLGSSPQLATAQTPSPLDAWRARIVETRTLSESDAPGAYEAAQRLLATLPADALPTDQVRALNLLARTEIYMALTEQSIVHTNQAFELAQQNGDKLGQAEADLNTSLNAVNEARIDKLVTATTRSLTELEGTDRTDLLSEALLRTATMYRRVGQIDDSVTTAMQAMEIARRSNDALALTYAHQGLAISFDQSFRFQEALEHFVQMRNQARRARSRQLEAYATMGIGGMTATLRGPAAGEASVREALATFRETRAPFAIAFGLTQLATNMRNQRRYAEALAALDEALTTYERYPNKIGLWYTLNARSLNHESLRNAAYARADAQRGYDLAKEIGFPLYISESAQRLANLAAAEGDFRQAYARTVEANEMTARAARERASARMVQLAQRYETESKQREINELTQRNRQQLADLQQAELRQRLLWTVLGASVLVFAGTVYFLLRLRRSQTELRRSEGVLRVREQEFRALVEHSPDLVVRYDQQCRRTYVNPALARAHRMPLAELLGSTPATLTDLPPEQSERYMRRLQEVLASGRDGSTDVLIGGRNIEFRLVAERDAQDRVASVLAIGRDVTAMMETQRQLTTLLDNLPDMVARFDHAGRYVYVNPAVARVVGWPPERFLGKTIEEVGLESSGMLQDAVAEVIAENAPNVVEVPWRRPDATRYFEVRHLPERDDRGQVVSVLGIAREVTERKRIEQLVRELGFRREAAREEERKYIARELHDELGQLLSALRFEVSVIRMRFGPAQPGIAERAASILSLVDSVIRLQRDLVSSLRPAVLDMGIGAALEWLVGQFGERSGIACTLELSESQVQLDANQTTVVFRIVQESLTNVARHAQATRVRVAVTRGESEYRVLVSDDGRGFDPQGDRDRKSLGLIGLQERAQMLNGQLEVRSTRGTGTTIVVTFPAASDAPVGRLEPVGEV
ncbi:MAG TPA: PAS domain-containing protein [Burkholderiaceae bacterium]|nr:PAS domain-containing protein [Burkholderiaceae bacterium]